MRRARLLLTLVGVVAVAAAAAGCGSSSSSAVNVPRIAPARVYTLGAFSPKGTVVPGRPTTVAFKVMLPSGQALTQYKTGAGPHTGVHLIIVRDDLHYIIHDHPPIGPGGQLRQTVTFPAPGRYRVLVDIYPKTGQANFQIFTSVTVAGSYRPRPLPAFHADQQIDGYRVDMIGEPHLHAIQAAFVNVVVTDRHGHTVTFTPWFGALAHAIFFRAGSLDYFHTHVCAPGAANCSSVLGAAKISGRSTAPGKLTLGVLLPVPGTWELFLQMQLGGRVLTAPFTLHVAS
jgi:hypothetical protein